MYIYTDYQEITSFGGVTSGGYITDVATGRMSETVFPLCENTRYRVHESMDVSQVLLNGEKFLQDRRPVILGLSPGNSHYCKREVLERLFDFIARKNSDKVSYFHCSVSEKFVEEPDNFFLFY